MDSRSPSGPGARRRAPVARQWSLIPLLLDDRWAFGTMLW